VSSSVEVPFLKTGRGSITTHHEILRNVGATTFFQAIV